MTGCTTNWGQRGFQGSIVFSILVFSILSPRAEGESRPKRWYLFGAIGQTSTPAVLQSTAGTTIKGSYRTPEVGYGAGLEIDFGTQLAMNLRPSYMMRNISYTQSTGLRDVSGTLNTASIHVPLQIKLIPKRWLALGVGAYTDLSVAGGMGTDFGSIFSLGLDIKLSKKAGFTLGVHYNSSFTTYNDITGREFLVQTGFRFGPNSVPALD